MMQNRKGGSNPPFFFAGICSDSAEKVTCIKMNGMVSYGILVADARRTGDETPGDCQLMSLREDFVPNRLLSSVIPGIMTVWFTKYTSFI